MYERYESIFAELEPPFAFVDLDAVARQRGGHAAPRAGQADPGRLQVGALPGAAAAGARAVAGVSRTAQPHLARGAVAARARPARSSSSPTRGRVSAALRELAALTAAEPGRRAGGDGRLRRAPRADRAAPSGPGAAPIRVCLDLDVGYWPLGGRLQFGPKRSPIRTPEPRRRLAAGDRPPAAGAARRA